MKKYIWYLIALALIGLAVFYYLKRSSSTLTEDADFAIADTSSIGKIFIADTRGNQVTLERQAAGKWLINDTYEARPDAINTLLKTFKNVYVREPVSEAAREHTLRVLAGSNSKVEIFDTDNKWLKTWYVGTNTPDNKGTFMLLENEKGRSSRPFIMTMKGFTGTLYTRFFTDVDEWRSPWVFTYSIPEISQVEVRYPQSPDNDFAIELSEDQKIKLTALGSDAVISAFDTMLVRDYLLHFKKAAFDRYQSDMDVAKKDSIFASEPMIEITVRDTANQSRVVRLYHREAVRPNYDEAGNLLPYHPASAYARLDDGEIALAQFLTWSNFMVPASHFTPEKKK